MDVYIMTGTCHLFTIYSLCWSRLTEFNNNNNNNNSNNIYKDFIRAFPF